MSKYHINDKGNPGICHAKIKCRFGDLSTEHYSSKEDALKAFENKEDNSILPKKISKNSPNNSSVNSSIDDEPKDKKKILDEIRKSPEKFLEAQRVEEEMLRKNRAEQRELTDEEYERHRDFLRLLTNNKNFPSTHKQFTKTIKGKVQYIPERRELHEKIITTITERYNHIPNENRAILMGGMPGSGKTTTLKRFIRNTDNYATINPDDVKELMVEYDMMPDIPGTLPLERDQSVIYEAQKITDEIYENLSKEGKNLIIDKTMLNVNTSTSNVNDLKNKGYQDIDVIFIDIEPDLSYERIISRHRKGIDKYLVNGEGLGQRAVSGSAIMASQPETGNYKSKNAETIAKMYDNGIFPKEPRIFDTTNPETVEIPFSEFKK